MNIDYVAEARRKQEEQDRQRFQQARDPFQYGRQVAQRRYSEIMSGLAERQRQSARTYSDMYQAAKESAKPRKRTVKIVINLLCFFNNASSFFNFFSLSSSYEINE